MAVILDTSAVSALLGGEPALAGVLRGAARHEIPVVVLGEHRCGLLRSNRRKHLETLLGRLVAASRVPPIDERTAAVYAGVRDQLRRQGTPIPGNDVWVAALALQHGLPVVSRDAHFEHVEGLTRLGW